MSETVYYCDLSQRPEHEYGHDLGADLDRLFQNFYEEAALSISYESLGTPTPGLSESGEFSAAAQSRLEVMRSLIGSKTQVYYHQDSDVGRYHRVFQGYEGTTEPQIPVPTGQDLESLQTSLVRIEHSNPTMGHIVLSSPVSIAKHAGHTTAAYHPFADLRINRGRVRPILSVFEVLYPGTRLTGRRRDELETYNSQSFVWYEVG